MIKKAKSEGWALFDHDSGDATLVQLQKLDDKNVFTDDSDAWRFVRSKATNGSEFHKRALEFVKQHNAVEYRSIMEAK